MQNYTYQYEAAASLVNFVEQNKFKEKKHVLIHIYLDDKDEQNYKEIKQQLNQLIPHARIFREKSSSGEEKDSEGANRKAFLSFSIFDDLTIEELTLQLAKTNQDLRESEQHYRSLFEQSPNLIYSMDRNGTIISVNPALIKETGHLPKDVRHTNAVKYVVKKHRRRSLQCFTKALRGKTQYFPMDIIGKGGEAKSFQITNLPIIVNDKIVGVYGIAQNIEEQKKDREKISRLAYHDSMTGLPNRLLLQQMLESMVKQADQEKRIMAVIFIDLDRFKIINDSVGHDKGDEILKKVAARMENKISKDHVLTRFNGDEFVLVVPNVKENEKVNDIVRRLIKSFDQPIAHNEDEFYLTASAGISLYPEDAKDAEELMKNADTALNLAKQKGAGKYQLFQEEMRIALYHRFELENDLRKALDKKEFLIFYQPQINLKTGKVCGCEALLRWRHPRMGLISPAKFIPLAEETGMINEIGKWVMKTACKQAKNWQDSGHEDFFVSVNVSVRQFQQQSFLNNVKEAIEESGLAPQYLHLELTESITLNNIRQSGIHVQSLKNLGVKVSIDDFGTGYSALSYLKDFSIDILKIDRSFVRNLRKDSNDGAIIQAILTMCKGLSMRAVAEGVETEEQLKLLKNYGCHCVQGFLYSQPLPVKIFEKFIYVRNRAKK